MPIPDNVYRLLGPNEQPTEALHPRSATGNVTVSGHVRKTCKNTQYISTSADLKGCEVFLEKAKKRQKCRSETYTIVKIDVRKLQKLMPDVTFTDLTDQQTLDLYIPKSKTSPEKGHQYNVRKWVAETKEILISGCSIPADCMDVVYDKTENIDMVDADYNALSTQLGAMKLSQSDAGQAAASKRSNSSKQSDSPKIEQTEKEKGEKTKANKTDSAQRGAVGGGSTTKAGKKTGDDEKEEEEGEEKTDKKKTKPKRMAKRP